MRAAWPGRAILKGCRKDVGARLLFPLAKGIEDELELTRYGVEFIELPIMASNLNSKDSQPALFYSNSGASRGSIAADLRRVPMTWRLRVDAS